MSQLPSRETMAAVTRQLIENHDEWDSLHALITVYRDGPDGSAIRFGSMTMIDPRVDPADYPAVIEGRVADDAANMGGPYALMLQAEAFMALSPKADAPAEEKAQFDRDRENRTIHARPDADEVVSVWTMDVHGRVWSATKRRSDSRVETHFFGPDAADRIGGKFVTALRRALAAHGSGLNPRDQMN